MPDAPLPCEKHAEHLVGIERRLTVLEILIGREANDGLRGMLLKLTTQLDVLTTQLTELQLAKARAAGAMEGATWLGRAVWALLGGVITAGAVALLKGP